MIKRLYNRTVYKVTYQNNTYMVQLERLKNSNSGNPRFQASIIPVSNTDTISFIYNFSGHYYSECDEALYIVKEHIARQMMMEQSL